MARLILTTCFLFIVIFSYSQQEQKILSKTLQSYKKELPKLERQAFKELRKLDKSDRKPKNNEFNNYHFIIIPMFTLKKEFVLYNDSDVFAKYLDFIKMHDDFEAFIFKDTIYAGSLHFSDYDNSYFSVNDTNKYNRPAFEGHLNLAKQIMNFKPDMVFYSDIFAKFLCFIKNNKLYIREQDKNNGNCKWENSGNILLSNEFARKNPDFIKEVKFIANPAFYNYKKP
jgi:hypothetical protein